MSSSPSLVTILQLPKEIIALIIGQLTPQDMVRFALSCGAFCNICQDNGDFERHSKYTRLFTDLSTGFPTPGTLQLDLEALLYKINEDWRVAHYIEAISINLDWCLAIEEGSSMTRDIGGLDDVVKNLEGSEDLTLAVFSMALQRLPNLQSITFYNTVGEEYYFANTKLCQRDEFSPCWTIPHHDHALPNLQVIEIRDTQPQTHDDILNTHTSVTFAEAFGDWVEMPTVKTLRAENVSFVDLSLHRSDTTVSAAHITALELTNCPLQYHCLDEFLETCPGLKRFVYHYTEDEFGNGVLNQSILDALQRHTTHSLEYLQLSGQMIPTAPEVLEEVSLKEFTKLRQAHLSLDFFIGEADIEHPGHYHGRQYFQLVDGMHDALPLSGFLSPRTEELVISDCRPIWIHKTESILRGLVTDVNAQACLPALKSVVFECQTFTPGDVEALTEYWAPRCLWFGLEVAFRQVG